MHECAFSSSSKHGSDPGVREAWFDLFHRYSVDLVLQGHDHTYERTHAMVADQVAGEGPTYRTDVGTVYLVCGNGGAVQETFDPVQPSWSAFRQELKVGTVKIEVDPNGPGGTRRLLLSEHWAMDGSVIEEGIVLERPSPVVAAAAPEEAGAPEQAPAQTEGGNGGEGGQGRAAAVGATAGASNRAAKTTSPRGTLPTTGGPAGTALIGVAAAAGGLAVRRLVREERAEELADSGRLD